MESKSTVRPRDVAELSDILRGCSASGGVVNIRAGGSKAAFGIPAGDSDMALDLSGLSGITLYEPDELVLTARAGTGLAEIASVLAGRGQCMAFEPPEFGALFGSDGGSTLGGMVASGWSGPRRIRNGAVRDHVLGVQAVGGDGQLFNSGGRVVKNVTGFDLPKLLTGSHGTLAALTEITIKVLPAPEVSRTLVVQGLDDAAGLRLLSDALGGPYELSGAAHLPAGIAARSSIADLIGPGASATLLRLEGFGPSVAERLQALEALSERRGDQIVIDSERGGALWREVRDVAILLRPGWTVWRLSLPATDAIAAVAAISRSQPVECWYDWGGSLVWLAFPPAADGHVTAAHASLVRGRLPSGHATLMRAPAAIRRETEIFHPQAAALAALGRRVKAAFDPAFILSPRRMKFEI
jgi:glycolate oxidase FAD binding subunit